MLSKITSSAIAFITTAGRTAPDSSKTPPKVSTNEKLTSTSSPIFRTASEVINKATNFAAKQISSKRPDINQIFADFKKTQVDKQKENAKKKTIDFHQKTIDNTFKELKPLERGLAELKHIQEKELKDTTITNERKEELEAKIESLETKLQQLKVKIDVSAVIIKTINSSQIVFKQIAQGKAKMVFEEYKITGDYRENTNLSNLYKEDHDFNTSYDKGNVYYTPVGTNPVTKFLKKQEIADEKKTGEEIKQELESKKILGADGESYIAIDMNVMNKREFQKNESYTVQTSRAEGDLKGAIKKGDLKFPVSVKIGLDILKGMSNLHEAGYVHGDGKNDNVLLAKVKNKEGEEELTGFIADLGKTRKMGPDEKGIMFGNPRFAAPEGGLSHSAEIYTTALLIINTLEGELLDIEGGDDMIISPKETDPNANTEGKFGIEKFLLQNKKCPQTDNTTLSKRVKIMGKEIKNQMIGNSNTAQLLEAQVQTDLYIDSLVLRLIAKNGASTTEEIEKLGNLLKAMTRAQVSGNEPRPSLQSVIPEYEAILKNLTSS